MIVLQVEFVSAVRADLAAFWIQAITSEWLLACSIVGDCWHGSPVYLSVVRLAPPKVMVRIKPATFSPGVPAKNSPGTGLGCRSIP